MLSKKVAAVSSDAAGIKALIAVRFNATCIIMMLLFAAMQVYTISLTLMRRLMPKCMRGDWALDLIFA